MMSDPHIVLSLIIGLTTMGVILLYMAYPLWLMIMKNNPANEENKAGEINCISVILLSYNGKKYLQGKINFLLGELSAFSYSELIIIDDHSNDGSIGLLENLEPDDRVKILCNSKHEGIPFSMNLGIASASFDHVVFCDQRQVLSTGILKKIVEPLKNENVGAVSGCISCKDNGERISFIRRHENFLKSAESRTGSLMGVYGPFYAIRKDCYCSIPGDVILDDLYLSLRILKTKQIIFSEDCTITDENFTSLYDLARTRKYLSGFLQILKDRTVMVGLSKNQRAMLLWHKYLRLLIPLMLISCYVTCGLMIFHNPEFLFLFASLTTIGAFSLLPFRIAPFFRGKNIFRLSIFYVVATMDVLIHKVYAHFKSQKKTLSA